MCVCVGVPCTDRTYMCADGTCLKKQNPACDFITDCPDASDEKNCGEIPLFKKIIKKTVVCPESVALVTIS